MSEQTAGEREADLLRTLVHLADTLVAGYEQFDLLTDLAAACVRILDIDTAGLSLAQDGELQFVVGTSEAMRVVELFQAAHQEGPCVEAFRSATHVHVPDIAVHRDRWPAWAPRALDLGFRAADAFPLRLRDDTIGALNVYTTQSRTMTERDVLVGTALADMAAIGILHERAHREGDVIQQQLEGALQSRIVIEQAKGVISEREGIEPDRAFERLRAYARSHNLKLLETARQIVEGEVELDQQAD